MCKLSPFLTHIKNLQKIDVEDLISIFKWSILVNPLILILEYTSIFLFPLFSFFRNNLKLMKELQGKSKEIPYLIYPNF
jgi:hypothetical protein